MNIFSTIFLTVNVLNVANGGIVYAFDHAGRFLMTEFPGLYSFTLGRPQTIRNASIVHTSLGIHMGSYQMDVHLNLD